MFQSPSAVVERLETITGDQDPRRGQKRNKLEWVDKKLIQIFLTAEQSLPIPKKWDWSPELFKATLIHAYWTITHQTRNRISRPPTETLTSIKTAIEEEGEDIYQGDPTRTISSQLRRSSNHLK